MDDLKVTSKFMTMMISKLVKTVIYKKFGYDVNIRINEIGVTSVDENIHVHLNVDGDINSDEFKKFTKFIEVED